MDDRIKKFNKEIMRLKALIPGLQCSNKMEAHRGQPFILCGHVDVDSMMFSVESGKEKPQVVASRLLDGHIRLMNRLYENVEALEEIVKAG